MATLKHFISKAGDQLLAFFGALFVLLPSNPLNMSLAYRDQGVFLYMAWRILNGEVPYRDVWDHKPPLIYLINTLGLALTPDSRWGVWLIELVLLTIATLLAYRILKEAFGPLPALSTLVITLVSLTFAMQSGNHATEYALLFQFGCLLLAMSAVDRGAWFWRGYAIGALSGLIFLTKQNCVGVALAIVIYLVAVRLRARAYRKILRELLSLFLGGSTVLAVAVILFARFGALPQFIDAAFTYNFAYAGSSSLTSHLTSIIRGFELLSESWLTQFAFIGVTAAVILVVFRGDFLQRAMPLLVIGLIALPIELLFIGVTGNSYPHYYVTLLPVFSIFSALAVHTLLLGVTQIRPGRAIQTAFIAALVGIFALTQLRHYRNTFTTYRLVGHPEAIAYVEERTSRDDTVLLWGAETAVNFFSGRRSPTEYVYQYPLFTEGYTNDQMVEAFLEDILENKPRLIIDAQDATMPFLSFPTSSPRSRSMANNVRSAYQSAGTLNSWIVYEYVGDFDQEP
jgi:4-amino-4-deoxy-L-arabinose transferase-like glycosyltransferase